MSKFEFLMMIASVVVAVGLAEIIAGWGKLLRSTNEEIRTDWLHLSFSIVLPFAFLNYWMGMWAYHPLELTYFGQIAFLVIPSFFIVLTAYAISPNFPEKEGFDSREFYLSKKKQIWLSFSAFYLSAMLADFVIAGKIQGTPEIVVPFISLILLLAFVRVIWFHVAALLLLTGFIGMSFFQDITVLDTQFLRTNSKSPIE